MLKLRVKVEDLGFDDRMKNRFMLRDEHILVSVNGTYGYVLDDSNRICPVKLDSMIVLSLEPAKTLLSKKDYVKNNPKPESKKAKAKNKKGEENEDVE